MNNRIKEIRKSQHLTQKEFGEKLGTTRDVIANIENNRVEPNEIFINYFCNQFNVNKNWLRSGEGEKYLSISEQDQLLAEIFATITLDENVKLKNVIEKLSKLDEEYLDVIEKLVEGLIR